jgi:DNA repair and recombination protein RAD54B
LPDALGYLSDTKPSVSRRKPTAKKNKTWDGDGILAARGGFLYLRDVGGKDMGRVAYESELEPGKMLYVAGKEVEIESEIPRAEYLAGKQFLNNAKPAPTPPSLPKKTPLPVLKRSVSRYIYLNSVVLFSF